MMFIRILFYLTVVLVISFVLYYMFRLEPEPYYENDEQYISNRWVVLLTTSVIDKNRESLYRSQISKWLNNTNLFIYVVESTGRNFLKDDPPHPRLFFYTFKMPSYFQEASSTFLEAYSIMQMLHKIKYHPPFMQCTHVLKVTGRYYLEGIEDKITRASPYFDLYLQKHRRFVSGQNSEYFGIRKRFFYDFIITVLRNTALMERVLYDYSKSRRWTYLGPFPNTISRGGDKKIIRHL